MMAAAAMLAASLLPLPARAKGWEPVKEDRIQGTSVVADTEIEIQAGRGVIYVNSSKPVNIKIYTILGSRVADDNLAAGTYRFVVPTHGIYLVKAGELTCKVAV